MQYLCKAPCDVVPSLKLEAVCIDLGGLCDLSLFNQIG
jgi:hypothetical protein